MSISELCSGQPDEFKVYIEYCRALRFEDCPDYRYLRALFSDLMKRKVQMNTKYDSKQFADDGIYDWMDESIAHNPTALPKHCVGPNGSIRKDLLRPASQAYREALLISGRDEVIEAQELKGQSGTSNSSLPQRVLSSLTSTASKLYG